MKTALRPTNLPTLSQLRLTYPTLRSLEAEADTHEEAGHYRTFCTNRIWYGEGRQRHHSLRARTIAIAEKAVKRFKMQGVYDVVYSAVYDRLPDCGDLCGCFDREGLR